MLMTTTNEKGNKIIKILDRRFFQSEKITAGDLTGKDDKKYEVQKLPYFSRAKIMTETERGKPFCLCFIIHYKWH